MLSPRALIVGQDGNIALMFSMILPLLLGAAGGAIDYAHYYLKKQSLQEVVDAAALAGARQYVIADAEARIPEHVARDVARAGINEQNAAGAVETVAADAAEAEVTVAIVYSFKPSFLVGMFESPLKVIVSATAKARGSANICVIGLKESGHDVIMLDDDASLSGVHCAVYVNSTDAKALVSKKNALLQSAQTCTAGGYEGNAANFDPAPVTDCPLREDPLATRTPPPPPGGCSYTDRQLKDYSGSIAPGVYCEGLKIDGHANVTMEPGIYFIKDGALEIKADARLTGADVGFFFYGDGAEMKIDGDATVELRAPLAGPLAGILFWRDPAATGSAKFLIKSPNVSTLVGTIYLPTGEFIGEIDAGGDIAEASAYTAIIAEKITLKKNSNLVLNSNYKATNVPVPDGIKGGDGNVFLRD